MGSRYRPLYALWILDKSPLQYQIFDHSVDEIHTRLYCAHISKVCISTVIDAKKADLIMASRRHTHFRSVNQPGPARISSNMILSTLRTSQNDNCGQRDGRVKLQLGVLYHLHVSDLRPQRTRQSTRSSKKTCRPLASATSTRGTQSSMRLRTGCSRYIVCSRSPDMKKISGDRVSVESTRWWAEEYGVECYVSKWRVGGVVFCCVCEFDRGRWWRGRCQIWTRGRTSL